jgi:two-component system, chemotaxis family, chemotaxis protein CheY
MTLFNSDMEVLIVDDASALRRIVRGLLKELGFKNMREADNGRLAMEELKKKKTDFVVCDWNMPVMTGLDLVKAIRADDELKSMPILMVTAEAKEENITKAVQAGLTNYIVKPFNAQTLQEKLNTIFP